MNNIDTLKDLIKLLQKDTITPKQVEEFLAVVLQTIKKAKEDINTISNEKLQIIEDSIEVMTTKHSHFLEGIEKNLNQKEQEVKDKVLTTTEEFDAKIQKINGIIKVLQSIKFKDGYTPVKGKDYFDGEDGKDADEDLIVEKVLQQIPPVVFPEVKLDTPTEIKEKLETLKKDERLDKKAIKGLEDYIDQKKLDFALGVLDSRTRFLINKAIPSSSGGGTWGSITGTLSDQTDLQTELNNKVTTVTSVSPIVVDNTDTTNPIVSIPQATTGSDGYLSATDWDTFNAKQGIISLTTSGSSGASTFDGSTLNVPNYTLSGLGMTFGTDNQMPFTNATGTGFEYSAEGIFDGHTMLLGTGNTISSTYKLQLEESANKAVYMLVRHNTSGTNSTAQLAVITPTAGGFFGAFDNSHNQAAWRDKAMFGAYSTASGIQIAAYNSGQKIWFQVGGLAASSIWATMLATGHLSLASNLDPLTNLHIQEATTETLPAVYINQTSTGDSALQWSIVGDAYAMGIDNSDSDAFKLSYSGTAGAAVLGTNDRFIMTDTGNVGFGTSVATTSAKFNVLATTLQMRLHYDASNYFDTTVDSNGETTFNSTGAGANFIFSDSVNVPDEAYGSGWNGSLQVPTKNAIYDVIGLDSPKTVKVTLSSAQILALNGTPIQLVAAPGAGFALQVISSASRLNYVSADYVVTNTIEIRNPSATVGQAVVANLNASASGMEADVLSNGGIIENEKLEIYATIANPTTGDSTMDIYLTYKIITL